MAIRNNDFIERSILGVLHFFKESVFSEEYALRRGLLQSLDPRIKTFTFFLFIVSVLFLKSIPLLFCLYLFCLLLAACSKIEIGFFLIRTWVFIPLFSLFIAVPALFSVFSPGEALFVFKLAGAKLVITRQGLSGAVLFILRVITSVSFVILLSLVTRHTDLLKVLRIFKVPQIFVMTLGMSYRYIYFFVSIIENTYLGIKSRVGTSIRHKKGQKIVALKIAGLWQRSYQLNEEVYNAMLSRGYRGEPRVLNEFKSGFLDWAWLFFAASVSVLAIYLNYRAKF